MLQSTVIAMKELTSLSQEIKTTFEKESDDMVRDARGQLEGMGHFEDHERRIGSLQGRVQAGRHKIEALSGRVDVVRKRVEGWERADREWQSRTRKRLRSIWIIFSMAFLLLALLIIGAKYSSLDVDLVESGAELLGNDEDSTSRPSVVEEGDDGDGEDTPGLPLWDDKPVEAEDRLRFLDEL